MVNGGRWSVKSQERILDTGIAGLSGRWLLSAFFKIRSSPSPVPCPLSPIPFRTVICSTVLFGSLMLHGGGMILAPNSHSTVRAPEEDSRCATPSIP